MSGATRQTTSLSSYLTSEQISATLRGRKSGASWIAHCPAHEAKTPSLSIAEEDGKVLVHCHAGCSQDPVIEALRERGLWEREGTPYQSSPAGLPKPSGTPSRRDQALRIWSRGAAAKDTVVDRYLRSRGIVVASELPESIRFHPGLDHPDGGRFPAMVALVTHGVTGESSAIHRTFLA